MTERLYNAAVVQGSIRSRGVSPAIVARFQFNPEKVSDRRQVTYTDVNAPGQILPFRQYVRGGDRALTFSIEIAGWLAAGTPPIDTGEDGDVSPEIRKYQSLLYPANPSWRSAGLSQAAQFSARREFKAPPTCLLCLGERTLDCILADLTVDETMFNGALRPIAASLRLTIKEIAPYGGPELAPVGAAPAGAGA